MLTPELMPKSSFLDFGSPEMPTYSLTAQPLDEEVGYQQLDAYLQRERYKKELAGLARIDDDALVGRLVDAGFSANTLPALPLAPIAFVAWASNSVSERESQAVIASIFESQLYRRPAAAARVQSWLDQRPTQALWQLWVDYTKKRLECASIKQRKIAGARLLRQATQVALASGGFMGLGSVCAAENEVLESIRNVFHRQF
ncbi:MAG: hypothetical protein WBD20_22355 [Pirellulaceae bacterium]